VKRALVFLVVLAACGDEIDPPWELDHDRIIAVRATPPAITDGTAQIDALLSAKGGTTSEARPEGATVISPMALQGSVSLDGTVTMPTAEQLAAARAELMLAADAPVPLQVGVVYGQGTLPALKIVWLGKQAENPVLSEMLVDGTALDAMPEIIVPRLIDVRFSVAAIDDDDVNWLTNVGDMHDFDLPQSYLRVEEDEEMTEGEFVLVKRDIDGGVVWRVWPIRVQ
jgi:hypothetical protein